MRKIAFIGAYDMMDIVLYIAKIFEKLNKRMLIVDATTLQKARYVVPVINPTMSYITEYENMDVAVGFDSFEEIERFLMVDNLDNLYDIVFVTTDIPEAYENFRLKEAERKFFVTSFDIYSLKKGLEVFSNEKDRVTLIKIMFSKNMSRKEEEYLEFLAMNYPIDWAKEKVYFPFEKGDQTLIYENQKTAKIKFSNLSSQFKDAIEILANDVFDDKEYDSGQIRKAIKRIEKE